MKRVAEARKSAAERLSAWLEQHRSRYPTDHAFAQAIACSPGRLSQLLGGKASSSKPSIELAQRIERAVDGDIPFSAWFELSRGRA